MRIELVHAAAHDRGRRLIASVGRVYYRREGVSCGIAHRGRSLISTIALFCFVFVCFYFSSEIDMAPYLLTKPNPTHDFWNWRDPTHIPEYSTPQGYC